MVAQKKSKTQIVKEYTALQQQFGDVKDSVVAVYPSGDKNVIVEFVASGTFQINPDFNCLFAPFLP